MDGESAKDGLGEPAYDPLIERIARLEAEVAALRGEVVALRAATPQAATSQETRENAANVDAMRSEEPEPIAAGLAQSAQVARPQAQANESLESQLGTRVLSKIAVVLLLVGVAWFLKWAFDNRWIGPMGRAAAGLLAGAGVILWSERFRRQQLAGFSYALKAVGAGVLYLSLWASVQLYHLVPAWVAFAAMVAVTAWNAVMAWSQDAQLLAGYALLGAYLTPLLLSTGGDHEVFLFSYLLVVAAALLALLRLKPWSALLLPALAATSGLFIEWYAEFFDASKGWRTAVLALLLWAAFAAAPWLAMETESVVATVLEPLAAGVFGALTIYSVLADSGGRDWEWICAAAFAAVYFAMAWGGLPRRAARAGGAAVAHLSLGVAFVTVAITLKAAGRGITVGWLVEAVVLLLAGFWMRAAAARWIGLVLLGATLAKTFAWDMRGVGTGYRVLSYLGLGVLLMAVSFAYQKDWLGLRKPGADAAGERNSDEAQA